MHGFSYKCKPPGWLVHIFVILIKITKGFSSGSNYRKFSLSSKNLLLQIVFHIQLVRSKFPELSRQFDMSIRQNIKLNGFFDAHLRGMFSCGHEC